jgi:(p)ppGpp synthase/HD superfamily hydrolase
MKLPLHSPVVHRALEFAAVAHRTQVRKGTRTPYISHPACVALLLTRAGLDDEVVAAGVLHDVVEDSDATPGEIRRLFGPRVARLVGALTERKRDKRGRKLSWHVRKREHFEHLRDSSDEIKTIALADRLHNLWSTYLDLQAGVDIWSRFNATREDWLAHAARMIEACDGKGRGQRALANECRAVLRKLMEREGGDARR